MSEVKIIKGIAVADILNHLSQPFPIIRQFPVFNVLPEEVAEDPAEILMARVGEKTPGIRQHSDETAEQSHVGQGCLLYTSPSPRD